MNEAKSFVAFLPDGWRTLPFRPFHAGVEIFEIVSGSPSIALLRYNPGASVPRHEHAGLETVLVLEGSQSDERGHYPVGSLVVNVQGSEHSVWSDEGCVVLIQWERPVEFV